MATGRLPLSDLVGLLDKGKASYYSSNFNDLNDVGIYRIENETMTNGPAHISWSYLVVVGNSTADDRAQFLIYLGGPEIFMRVKNGYPATWRSWTKLH